MKNEPIQYKIKLPFLKNLHIISIEEKLRTQAKQILELQIALVGVTSEQYKAESLYVQKNGITVFPYQQIKEMPPVEAGIDEVLRLPYVVHKGKRLYFPHENSIDQCITAYHYCPVIFHQSESWRSSSGF